MVVVLTFALFLILIWIYIANDNSYKYKDKNKLRKFIYDIGGYSLSIWSMILSVTTGIILLIMLIVIGVHHCGASGQKAKLQEQYKTLIYKAKTEASRDEFGIKNKILIDEIQDWNMDVVKYKKYNEDIWIDIFYPEYLSEFETIDLENIIYKK